MKTSQKRAILGLIVGGSLAAGIFGCPASFPDVGPYGGVDDASDTDGQIIPPGCDLTADPKDSAACVDESIGLFVSANGSDSNAGTKGSPLKTITAALAKVTSQHSRVYVCDGTYGEEVKVSSVVGIYGGFSCTDWSYDGTAGKVGPTGTGYALDIEGVSGTPGVTIEDLEFDAQNGVNPGDSSIAVFVASSTVTLKRVTAVAGNGVTGADAIATSNYDADAGDASLQGNNGSGFTGGAAQSCAGLCADGTHSLGGRGGDSNAAGADGGPSIAPNPNDGFHDGIGGASGVLCNAHYGSSAPAADAGAPSAQLSGHLSQTGWTSTSASPGTTGGVAQGGGGGGGNMPTATGGGGGGGCGGCGGAGGNGGMSGGSSFALLIYQATMTIDTCTLTAENAGDGKFGGAGQPGETGGVGGTAAQASGAGCAGGTGGNGGDGAGGGGGAGGNAIAIGYVGTKPVTTTITMTEGTAGKAGEGGSGPSGNNGLSGAVGTKADIQELP